MKADIDNNVRVSVVQSVPASAPSKRREGKWCRFIGEFDTRADKALADTPEEYPDGYIEALEGFANPSSAYTGIKYAATRGGRTDVSVSTRTRSDGEKVIYVHRQLEGGAE